MIDDIVKTNIKYNHDILCNDIKLLKNKYTFMQTGIIGKSVMKKDIPYIKLGNGNKEIIYTYSIHGNEWITSILCMKFVEQLCKAYVNNEKKYIYNVKELFEKCSLYLVPMLNPDGVNLLTDNIDINCNEYIKAKRISEKYPNLRFPEDWKANILGVDLNLQFPASWKKGKKINKKNGYGEPAPRKYAGLLPVNQKESKAIYSFVLKHKFQLMLCFHTQGEVIYSKYLNYNPEGSQKIAEAFSKSSGYEIANTSEDSSYAGLKDWFIQKYNKPGYTIEVGKGINPISISQIEDIYEKNIGIHILGMIL